MKINHDEKTKFRLYQVKEPMNLAQVKLVLLSKVGFSMGGGTISIDIKKSSTLTGTYTSVFTTPISTTLSADGTEVVGTIASGHEVLNVGDWLSLDIISTQTYQPQIIIDAYGVPS
jgi:hypothetical protein